MATTGNQRGQELASRLLSLAAGCLRLAEELGESPSVKHVARQLIRASTGGGANYEEARGAESSADFVHKIGIALKEVRETLYWLKVIEQADLSRSSALPSLLSEADQLVAILMASGRTARRNLQGTDA